MQKMTSSRASMGSGSIADTPAERSTARRAPRILAMVMAVFTSLSLSSSPVFANPAVHKGVIDETPSNRGQSDKKKIAKEVKAERKELAKLSRAELKNKADDGERLAQVVLGNDFAEEAQMLVFAPAAANDANSDALRWYSLAAQRGFPGALSLDESGVSFYPVRVVRNK